MSIYVPTQQVTWRQNIAGELTMLQSLKKHLGNQVTAILAFLVSETNYFLTMSSLLNSWYIKINKIIYIVAQSPITSLSFLNNQQIDFSKGLRILI